MREGGVEPPRPFGHWNLNPARLPIPPPAHWVCPRALAPRGLAPSDMQKISTVHGVDSHPFPLGRTPRSPDPDAPRKPPISTHRHSPAPAPAPNCPHPLIARRQLPPAAPATPATSSDQPLPSPAPPSRHRLPPAHRQPHPLPPAPPPTPPTPTRSHQHIRHPHRHPRPPPQSPPTDPPTPPEHPTNPHRTPSIPRYVSTWTASRINLVPVTAISPGGGQGPQSGAGHLSAAPSTILGRSTDGSTARE